MKEHRQSPIKKQKQRHTANTKYMYIILHDDMALRDMTLLSDFHQLELTHPNPSSPFLILCLRISSYAVWRAGAGQQHCKPSPGVYF